MASQIYQTTNSEEMSALLAQLPKEKWRGEHDIYQWEGSWYLPSIIESSIAFRSNFKPRDDDIILASHIKCGTTWLKALVLSIIHGRKIDDAEDLLLTDSPHGIVKTLEYDTYHVSKTPDVSVIHSPRIFHTHLPYHSLPNSVKDSPCKIVYVARNPKDTFVSLYQFSSRNNTTWQGPNLINQMFEDFCSGVYPCGPHLDHVLEYWSESVKMPEKIQFLKYEDLKRDTKTQLKKLAEFLDKPFGLDEEINKVIWRCSIERLKNLEVNMSGTTTAGLSRRNFFRRGVVGDWKNSLTMEMSERLDQLTRMKLEGSGLDFNIGELEE